MLKIQHPGVRPMLLQDLQDLNTIVCWVATAEPNYDMRPVLDAWIDMVPLETNFIHEMKNLVSIRNALRDAPPHLSADAYVPEALPELTSDKLFVMEYIEGCKVTDCTVLHDHDVDLNALIVNITRSFGNQLFFGGVFSGDPHPGNFLVHKLQDGGVPVLLDFGICVHVSEQVRIGCAKLILAAIDNDSYSLVQALGEVGLKLNRADPVSSLDIIKYLFRSTKPNKESRKEQNEMRKRLDNRNEEIKKNEKDNPIDSAFRGSEDSDDSEGIANQKSRSPVDSLSSEVVFFFRALGMLRGLAVTLDVRHSYLNTLRPFAQHVLKECCPEKERLMGCVYRPIFTKGPSSAKTSAILGKIFKLLYDNDMMIGMQVSAYKDGDLVLNMASGRMGRYNERPVKPDSVFNSFSVTKGLSGILFASIQDEYGVELDDLVTKYWPEYGQNGKEETTVGNILSHSAGLAASLPKDMAMVRLRDDWCGIIKHFEKEKPAHKPGEKTEYHALTFGWLIAGLIMKITGSSYQELLISLCKRLGIEHECYCGTMPTDLLADVPGSRVASLSSSVFHDLKDGAIGNYIKMVMKRGDEMNVEENSKSKNERGVADDTNENMFDFQEQANKLIKDLKLPASGLSNAPAYILDLNFFNHSVLRSGFLPSANGHFSARALAKLYAAVANDGIVEGTRVLATGRSKKMGMKAINNSNHDLWDGEWGAGLMLYDTVDKDGKEMKGEAVGNGGAGGSFAFAVPSHRFSMAVTLNKLNVLSISSAVVVAVVCSAMDIPRPKRYDWVASKVLGEISQEKMDDAVIGDEGSLMEKILSGGEVKDVMKNFFG